VSKIGRLFSKSARGGRSQAKRRTAEAAALRSAEAAAASAEARASAGATGANTGADMNAGTDVFAHHGAAQGAAGLPGGELVAVLAGAIAHFTGGDVSSFRVVSYRRTGQTSPVWNLRARNDLGL